MNDQVDTDGQQHKDSPEPDAPQVLRLAWWLWIASAAVGVLRAIIQLTDRESLIRSLREGAPEMNQDELDQAANAGVLMSLLMAAAVFAIYLLLANKMLRGRNWARIVMAVFCAFSLAGALIVLLGVGSMGLGQVSAAAGVEFDGLDLLISILVAALDTAVLVLLLRPEANRWYRKA